MKKKSYMQLCNMINLDQATINAYVAAKDADDVELQNAIMDAFAPTTIDVPLTRRAFEVRKASGFANRDPRTYKKYVALFEFSCDIISAICGMALKLPPEEYVELLKQLR